MSETIFGNWKPFKNYEKCIYFTVKALSVLEIFTFLFWLLSHVEKQRE